MSDDIRGAMEAAVTASDESPASEPASTPEPASPEPTTNPVISDAPPPSDTGAPPADSPRGPIPYDRHEAVLRKAREQYSWLDEHGDQQTVQQKLAILRRAEQDPAGFLRDFAAAARLNPQEMFQPAAPPAPPPAAPEPDILLENGQMTYSNERLQQLLAFQQQQLEQRFNRELAPIKQERAVTQMQQQALTRAQQQLSGAQQWSGFAENKTEIGAFLRANPTASLSDAYIAVVPAKLAEQAQKAGTEAYQKALSDLQQKAGAASTLAPRTSGNASQTAPGSIREALEQALNG